MLEVLKAQDAPDEVLEDEDPSRTMPRRLGLSDVVLRQIGMLREAAKKGERISDSHLQDLIQLVVRRPDATDVFWKVGRRLAEGDTAPLARFMPEGVRYSALRRRVRRGLRALLGRRIGEFAEGPFTLVGRELLFVRQTPGGESCYLVSGYCQSITDVVLGEEYHVVHDRCEGRGDDQCRWTITADARVAEQRSVREWMPEPEAG